MKRKDMCKAPEPDQAMESRIQLEGIRILYGSMMLSMLATFMVSLIMYLVLLGHAILIEYCQYGLPSWWNPFCCVAGTPTVSSTPTL